MNGNWKSLVEWVHVTLFYMFLLVLWREIFLFYFTTLNRRGVYHISEIILKLGYWIPFHPRPYYWINYMALLENFQIKSMMQLIIIICAFGIQRKARTVYCLELMNHKTDVPIYRETLWIKRFIKNNSWFICNKLQESILLSERKTRKNI